MSNHEGSETVEDILARRSKRPKYYHRDGSPIYSTELMPDWEQWALLFKTADRRIAENVTLYGERLSTVFLGMDHSWSLNPDAPPILFETMLFAPRSDELRLHMLDRIREIANIGFENAEYIETDEEKRIAKNFPHDQLQLRYSMEREAQDKHEELKLQCLIPPRWRRFLLYTIGEDETWE